MLVYQRVTIYNHPSYCSVMNMSSTLSWILFGQISLWSIKNRNSSKKPTVVMGSRHFLSTTNHSLKAESPIFWWQKNGGFNQNCWWFLPCFQRSLGEVSHFRSDGALWESLWSTPRHILVKHRDESFPTWKRNERWSLEEKFFIGS